MSVGMHSVLVYPDRSAGNWSNPVASNPYFALSAQGWREAPFSTALQWLSDGRIYLANGGLSRDENYPVARPAGVATYRVRASVSYDQNSYVSFGFTLGKTAHDAWAGAYFSPNAAKDYSVGQWLPAGSHELVATWVAPANVGPEYGFLSVYVGNPTTDYVHQIPMTVDYLILDYLTSGGADVSCLVDQVTINHGRDDTASQPEPASATLDFTITPADPLPAVVEVGAVVTVATTTDVVSSQRFVGRITDITLGWDDQGEDTPEAGTGQLICTSLMADLGRRVVGDVPWAQELDGARISRIMAAAGVVMDPLWNDPGTVQVIARDVDSQPALDLAQGVAADASGVLWHTRSGDIRYADADHRRGVEPSLVLDSCDVLVTPTWRRTTEGLINDVSIGYGVEPVDGGDQPRAYAASAASQNRYGKYGYTATTQLARAADAQALANLLMVRNDTPVWIMAALPVHVAGLSKDQTSALLALDMHDLLDLAGMPAIATAPTSAVLWVEGWKETLAFGVHDLELVVSGYCRTAPPPRWDDTSPAMTWNTADASLTWDSLACLGPQSGGRWADVPAALRWSQVAPGVTWDTWKSSATTKEPLRQLEEVS